MSTIDDQNDTHDDVPTTSAPTVMSTAIAPRDINGSLIIDRRHALGLSRDAFAQLVEMRPGAIWRLEVKNVFKPEEREHLASIADRWLVGSATTVLPVHPRPSKSSPSITTTKPTSTTVDDVPDLVVVTTKRDEDAITVLREYQKELVFSFDQVSPTVLSIMDGFQRVSNSEMQTFKRCRRKWWLTYICALQVKTTRPFGACATGTRIHLALAAWYKPEGEKRLDPRDALEVVIRRERKKITTHLDPDIDAETLSAFNKDVELERVVVAGYLEWLKETGIDADYTVIGSERYLEATLPEIDNTRIIARLDARVKRTYDNVHMFIDHKTVAGILQAVRMLTLNEQMMWYILLEELQPDRDPEQRVGGALYNMLRRCKRTTTAKPPFYERVEVHHNPIEIESFRRRLVGTLTEMQRCRDELTVDRSLHYQVAYPTPTRDCVWDCPFLKVCTMFDDGSRVEDALEAHYIVGDPYSYYASTPIETTSSTQKV